MKADDTVKAAVWITNPGDIELLEVEARVERPDFILLSSFSHASQKCGTGGDHTSLKLGPIPPHGTLSGVICLTVTSRVREGDYNLLFVFPYRSSVGEIPTSSFLAVEKKIQIGLLGTESVGGFSLRLVALFVPGLLFWLVLQFFHLGGPIQSAIDKGALAVLTSVSLVALASHFYPVWFAGGTSVPGFLALCAVGAALGGIVIASAYLLRKLIKRSLRDRLVQPQDSAKMALCKLLAFQDRGLLGRFLHLRRKGVLLNPTIQLKDGRELTGCLFGAAAEGSILIGSYRISVTDPALRKIFSELQAKKRWVELLDLAEKEGLSLTPDTPVKELKRPGSPWRDLGERFPVADTEIVNRSEAQGEWVPVAVV